MASSATVAAPETIFEAFTPEFGYEMCGEPIHWSDGAYIASMRFRGEPQIVLAVVVDAEGARTVSYMHLRRGSLGVLDHLMDRAERWQGTPDDDVPDGEE